jgi:hypothetical protein
MQYYINPLSYGMNWSPVRRRLRFDTFILLAWGGAMENEFGRISVGRCSATAFNA